MPTPRKGLLRGQRLEYWKAQRIKELRQQSTPAEDALWLRLKGDRLGFHFRRQQLIRGFIADLYCHQASLVIELDGPIHDQQRAYDEQRSRVFEAEGLFVLRFRNEEVLQDIDRTLLKIRTVCRQRTQTEREPNATDL